MLTAAVLTDANRSGLITDRPIRRAPPAGSCTSCHHTVVLWRLRLAADQLLPFEDDVKVG